MGCVDRVGSPREGGETPWGASAGSLELIGCGPEQHQLGSKGPEGLAWCLQGSVFPVTVRSFPTRYLPSDFALSQTETEWSVVFH